jgi:gamma-polyglutamate biosynthesis protein CapA
LSSEKYTMLTAVGDMMFYGQMARNMTAANDPLWAFRPLGSALVEGDLLFGNFETPISVERRNEPDAPDRFFSPAGVGESLKRYGFNVVNLANNHIYDFGTEGVQCTVQELKKAGLAYFGIGLTDDEASKPIIVNSRNGMQFGFLGYTTANNVLDRKHKYIACFPDLKKINQQVHELAEKVDIVVVSCHTGSQFNPYPAPDTRKLASTSIEAGASVFLGHHPHIPQGIERIGTGIAIYSLGDFVAPPHTEQTRRTYFIRIRFVGKVVDDYQVVPCFISDDCRTSLAEGETKEKIISNITNLSAAISENKSDELHFQWARGRFFSQYLKSWKEEYRIGGLRMFWRKIRSFRKYHFQLIGQTILSKIRFLKV